MNGTELLNKMELINPAYIEAADTAPRRRKNTWKRWCAAAACLCLACSLAVPATAAAVPAFHDVLYAVSPAAAQFFQPVRLSCEDNGIRMEVTAAYIHENTAEIYISMQDLEETRIDETIDLFDSYQIHTPFSCTGHCELAGYDPDTQTAAFLITMEQWSAQNIIGDKLTFSVREFLNKKKSYNGIIDGVDLAGAGQDPLTQTVQPRGISGMDSAQMHEHSASQDASAVLKSTEILASPVEGAALTGIGYIDGSLHVQVYYEDILNTDNHGSISLQNKASKERIPCTASISFFDEAQKGSYEDYIFPDIPADTLASYELYGDFTTSSGPIKGNWSITFPLENTGGE